MESGFKEMRERLTEITAVLPPTVRTVAELELHVHDLRRRIGRLEKKVGLTK